MLEWPKHHSKTAVVITALDVPTVRCRILVRKLGFLHRVTGRNSESLSGHVMLALCEDIDSLCMVRECGEPEECFSTSFTDDVLSRGACSVNMMKAVYQHD